LKRSQSRGADVIVRARADIILRIVVAIAGAADLSLFAPHAHVETLVPPRASRNAVI